MVYNETMDMCVFLAKLSEMAMDIYIYSTLYIIYIHMYYAYYIIIYIIIYIDLCVFAKSILSDMIFMVSITKHMTHGGVYLEHVFFLIGNMIKHQILGYLFSEQWGLGSRRVAGKVFIEVSH
jgi:hypothetical protein